MSFYMLYEYICFVVLKGNFNLLVLFVVHAQDPDVETLT